MTMEDDFGWQTNCDVESWPMELKANPCHKMVQTVDIQVIKQQI